MSEGPSETQESGLSGASGSTPTSGSARIRGGIRRSSAGFEAELRGYLQSRLRVAAAFIVATAGALYLVDLGLALQRGRWSLDYFVTPARILHAAAFLGALVTWVALRRRRFDLPGLCGADLLLILVTLVTCTGIYAFDYENGMTSLPGMLALFLVARALIVPSTTRRTLLYSIPAPLLFLGVKLAYGKAYAWHLMPIPDDQFIYSVIWDQCTLWIGVALAALASKVNFSLRVEAWEARQLDQYVIESRLGVGGQGEVYRARHAMLRRPTAIKLIRSDTVGPRTLKRFEKEVRQTSRLTHPNTIRIFDYGRSAEGVFYYAMELLDGADLDRIVDVAGPMPAARVIHVLAQACAALHEAHEKGLVHRDVKAGNLILCTRGLDRDVVKVMDFGLVKTIDTGDASLTRADEICGSPHTMAPEGMLGDPITRRSDLYSLAAVGCYLLTGKPVFDGKTVIEIASAHLNQEPTPPSARVDGVPADLEAVLLRCLAKAPEARFADADALRAALLACADAGSWTQAEARAWWDEHEERLDAAEPDGEPSSSDA
jgi:serine/threonine-protein kinase